jgi:hypothetical protein
MSTESVPMSSRTARNLWQIPTFLIGIAALFGVWYARPYLQPSAAQRFQKDLNAIRQVLEKTPQDRKQLLSLLHRIDSPNAPRELLGQTQFLLGSVHINLAETSENESEATDHWQAARMYLEAAQVGNLSENDTQQLTFRLGKTWANIGDVEPPKVIEILSKSLTKADDPADGYRLLAEQHLKNQPPDPRKARDSYREYLSRALPRTDPKILNQSRLRLGELYTQLGELEDARKVLSRIGEDAPTAVLVASRTQLARGYQAEEDWPSAVRSLEEALKAPGLDTKQKYPIQYQLGNFYLKVNRATDAISLFEQVRKASGEEAQAASIDLAELQLRAKDRETSAQLLELAVEKVNSPSDYRNPYLPLNRARATYEVVINIYRSNGEFPLAQRVAKAYGKICEPGRNIELAAETFEAWGDANEKLVKNGEPEAERFKEEAQKHFREGANELQALLKLNKLPAEKNKIITDLARLYTRAGEKEEAKKLLQEQQGTTEVVTPIPIPMKEPKEEDWVKKGESFLAVGDRTKAIQAFEKASEQIGPNQSKARLHLAQIFLEENVPERQAQGISLLEKIEGPDAEKDREVHEKATYLLGFTLYNRYDWTKAEYRLGRAIQFYPESAQAIKARFQRGRCFWYLAAQRATKIKEVSAKLHELSSDPTGASPSEADLRLKKQLQEQKTQEEKSYNENLAKARVPFQELENLLLTKKQSTVLSTDETKHLRMSSFAIAECAFYLGEYDDCVRRYETLGERYQGQVEELMALSQLWQCFSVYLEEPKKADFVLARMQTAYQKLKDSDYDNTIEQRSKKFWEKWFQQVEGPK